MTICSVLHDRMELSPGAVINLEPTPGRIHLSDESSGERLDKERT